MLGQASAGGARRRARSLRLTAGQPEQENCLVHLTSSSELPTYTVAGQQPHDAAPEPQGSFPASRQEPSGLAKGALRGLRRKHLGHSPTFAIAQGTAVATLSFSLTVLGVDPRLQHDRPVPDGKPPAPSRLRITKQPKQEKCLPSPPPGRGRNRQPR